MSVLVAAIIDKKGQFCYIFKEFHARMGFFLDKNKIFLCIKDILVHEFNIEADLINPEKKLYDDLDLDSLDLVDLILGLKDHIGEKINPDLFKEACTVQDLVNIVDPFWKY
ncbi:MAG: acyl carrier protein [Brevinematales bacterium]|nr:acyl carrier protein [Brevinematales bacterium]